MNMTKSEIVKSYTDAKSPAQQVQILAELNATYKDHIKSVLMEAGYLKTMLSGKDMKLEQSKIEKMVADGIGVTGIAKSYHTTTQRMQDIMTEIGIEVPKDKRIKSKNSEKIKKEHKVTPKVSTESENKAMGITSGGIIITDMGLPMTDAERHQQLINQLHDTFVAKNNDYDNSFSKSYDKYGIAAAMVRMEDKWNRLESLTSGKKQMVNDESVQDTLLDLANYCIMTVMEMQKRGNNDE